LGERGRLPTAGSQTAFRATYDAAEAERLSVAAAATLVDRR